MHNRRDVLMIGAMAAMAPRAGRSDAWVAPARQVPSRLQTRLFNFRDDVAPEQINRVLASLKNVARLPGVGGFSAGRNIVPLTYRTRFEWMYIIQFTETPEAPSSGRTGETFDRRRDALLSLCRNDVECTLVCPLPASFANAPGVKVRHTVMFDFKPDATAEARERNIAAIRGMGRLPMVQHYVVEPGAATSANKAQMQWQVIGDFASMADYKAYSESPLHLTIRQDFTANTMRVTWLDIAV